jgi:hypothetical protein
MLTGKAKKTKTDRKEATAKDVRFDDHFFIIVLSDGRKISIPLSFYPTLANATPAQRSQFEIFGSGRAISWAGLDLDLNVQFLLDGAREGIPKPPPMKLLKTRFRERPKKLVGRHQ